MVEREPSISEEQLHAYVDGQIAGGECAAVERWLESHPEDAARVAAWRAQAEALRARYGDKVVTPLVAPSSGLLSGLLGRKSAGAGTLASLDGFAGLPDEVISALESRAIWAKFGF